MPRLFFVISFERSSDPSPVVVITHKMIPFPPLRKIRFIITFLRLRESALLPPFPEPLAASWPAHKRTRKRFDFQVTLFTSFLLQEAFFVVAPQGWPPGNV